MNNVLDMSKTRSVCPLRAAPPLGGGGAKGFDDPLIAVKLSRITVRRHRLNLKGRLFQ